MRIDSDVLIQIIENDEQKYLTALGLFYLRLIGKEHKIYEILEKFYCDY